MIQHRVERGGFTLIELLTVIAIIGVLAGFLAVAAPRALTRAKMASMQNTMNQLRTSLVAYSLDRASYPPSYGYVAKTARDKPAASLAIPGDLELAPYLTFLDFYRNFDMYDPFSESTDTNRDGLISILEWSPVGPNFPTILFVGNNLPNEVSRQIEMNQRPFLYFAANRRQVRILSDFLVAENPSDPRPRNTSNTFDFRTRMRFPPPTYDAYVLISVGPFGQTSGLIPTVDSIPGNFLFDGIHVYHVLGMFAYFMATRDADDNGKLDFEYTARTTGNEGDSPFNDMPALNLTKSPGPVIELSP